MELQKLFADPILSVTELSPGYENHASDVWLVKTAAEEAVVRSSRMPQEPVNDFWWGCKYLFGIDPTRVFDLQIVNQRLYQPEGIPVPQVIRREMINNREFVVLEKMHGSVVHSFFRQPASLLASLGRGLALIHRCKYDFIGNLSGSFQLDRDRFHSHASTVMKQLVEKYYAEREAFVQELPYMCSLMELLPVPSYSSPVMIDLDPTQFLSAGGAITAMIDTEAYAAAPTEK